MQPNLYVPVDPEDVATKIAPLRASESTGSSRRLMECWPARGTLVLAQSRTQAPSLEIAPAALPGRSLPNHQDRLVEFCLSSAAQKSVMHCGACKVQSPSTSIVLPASSKQV
jgi:hypothetical protein